MSKILNNKGMTVIEIMLAVVIAGSIATAMAGFLTVHIKSYEVTQDITNIQYEGQLALNNMSRIAMESKGINSLNSYTGTVDLQAARDEINTSEISFIGLPNDSGDTVYHIFTYDYASNSTEIWYSNSTSAGIELSTRYNNGLFARNIEDFQVAPAQNTGTTGQVSFDDSNGIEFKLSLVDGNAELDVATLVKYRNKFDD